MQVHLTVGNALESFVALCFWLSKQNHHKRRLSEMFFHMPLTEMPPVFCVHHPVSQMQSGSTINTEGQLQNASQSITDAGDNLLMDQ